MALFDKPGRRSGAARLEACLPRLPQNPVTRPTGRSLSGNQTQTRWKRPAPYRRAVGVGHNTREADLHSKPAAGRSRPVAARCSQAERR